MLTSDDREARQERRWVAGCYLGAWAFTVLPVVGIYALGGGMSGSSILKLPGDIIRKALEMDLLAIWIVVGSLPMILLPYWLWTELRRSL